MALDDAGLGHLDELRVRPQLGDRAGVAVAHGAADPAHQRADQLADLAPVGDRAGDALDLTFGDAEKLSDGESARTELTLQVPNNANVLLAGTQTSQTGDQRTYATSALAEGEAWRDYVVRVEVEQDGQTLAEEKTLDIVGGRRYELSFTFADESAKLAAVE